MTVLPRTDSDTDLDRDDIISPNHISGADNLTNCAFRYKSIKLGTHQLHIIVVILKMGYPQFS